MKVVVLGQKQIRKVCGCGRHWWSVPKVAKAWVDEGELMGYVWNCSCKSTLFVKAAKIITPAQVLTQCAE